MCRFKEQYARFLEVMCYKRAPDVSDKLSMTYYLLLQDRVDEALLCFNKISKDVTTFSTACQIQYDYMAAYLDLFNDSPTLAPKIAAKHANYPVPRYECLAALTLNYL